MFKKGDRVIATEDYEGNNTKDKIGTVVYVSYSEPKLEIQFDSGQDMKWDKWFLRITLLKPIPNSEY